MSRRYLPVLTSLEDTKRQNNTRMDVDNRNVCGRPHEIVSYIETHYVRSTTEFGRYFDSFDNRTTADADVTGHNNRIGTRTE